MRVGGRSYVSRGREHGRPLLPPESDGSMKLSFRRLITTAVVAVAAVVPLTATAASAATPTPGAYRMYSAMFNQCLGGRADDVVSLAEGKLDFGDQGWVGEPGSAPGYYRIRNQVRNVCLAFNKSSNGSEARTSSCVDTFDDQWWTFLGTIPVGDAVLVRNYHTGK